MADWGRATTNRRSSRYFTTCTIGPSTIALGALHSTISPLISGCHGTMMALVPESIIAKYSSETGTTAWCKNNHRSCGPYSSLWCWLCLCWPCYRWTFWQLHHTPGRVFGPPVLGILRRTPLWLYLSQSEGRQGIMLSPESKPWPRSFLPPALSLLFLSLRYQLDAHSCSDLPSCMFLDKGDTLLSSLRCPLLFHLPCCLRFAVLCSSTSFANLLWLWWLLNQPFNRTSGSGASVGSFALGSWCNNASLCFFLWLFLNRNLSLVCSFRFRLHSWSRNSREASHNCSILNKSHFHRSERLNDFSGTRVHHWHGMALDFCWAQSSPSC